MAHGISIEQRKTNKRNHIIDLFRQHKVLSKADARKYSRYSMDTVISIFNGLIAEQIIVSADGEQKSKGRKAVFFSLNLEKWHYLGITFNQNGIFSLLMSFSNDVKEKHSTEVPFGIEKESFTQEFIGHIKSILGRNRTYEKSLLAIGCSIPGDIDLHTGVLHSYTLMPYLKDLNFKEILENGYSKTKIVIEHNIFSMSSYLLRQKELIQSYSRILFVSARSGTASGYIFNGMIVTGHGEFGHIQVSDEDVRCICGRAGCLDCYFSYMGFLDILKSKKDVDVNIEDSMFDLPGLDRLRQYYQKGNNAIAKELGRRLYYFSNALLDAINATVPDLVILSGDLFKVFGDPVSEIKAKIDEFYQNVGYVTHYEKVKMMFLDMGTEIASLGICMEMIRKDWDYTEI